VNKCVVRSTSSEDKFTRRSPDPCYSFTDTGALASQFRLGCSFSSTQHKANVKCFGAYIGGQEGRHFCNINHNSSLSVKRQEASRSSTSLEPNKQTRFTTRVPLSGTADRPRDPPIDWHRLSFLFPRIYQL